MMKVTMNVTQCTTFECTKIYEDTQAIENGK